MFLNKKAVLFIPSGKSKEEVLPYITHMAIGAHQDDLEIMSYHGIASCYKQADKSYFGVVVTDGGGSARSGAYANYTDEEMKQVRFQEQEKAAVLGEFGALAQLQYSSKETKDPHNQVLVQEFAQLIQLAKPDILYTHNLADKHDTHIGVTTKVIQAIRSLPVENRPKALYGCEVWRDLDWLEDNHKVCLDASFYPALASELVKLFDSQISGGKRYDLATLGRRLANATFFQSHQVDTSNAVTYAMDLTPLIKDDSLSITDYVTSFIDSFKQDVTQRITKILP